MDSMYEALDGLVDEVELLRDINETFDRWANEVDADDWYEFDMEGDDDESL